MKKNSHNPLIQALLFIELKEISSFFTEQQGISFCRLIFKTLNEVSLPHFQERTFTNVSTLLGQLLEICNCFSELQEQMVWKQHDVEQDVLIFMIVLIWKCLSESKKDRFFVEKDTQCEAKFIDRFIENIQITYGQSSIDKFQILDVLYGKKRQNQTAPIKQEHSFGKKTNVLVQLLRKCEPRTVKESKNTQEQHLDCITKQLIGCMIQTEFSHWKDLRKQPWIKFQRLNYHHHAETITLFFSGFCSESSCKLGEWGKFLGKYQSEAYSVCWESKEYQNIISFLLKNLVPIASPVLAIVGTAIRTFLNFDKNPFFQAVRMAEIAGQIIAELLIHNFEGYKVNLIGFSLGTELICKLLGRLSIRGKTNIVNKVVLMGGAADYHNIRSILEHSPHSLTVYNFYSSNDYILKYLLKAVKPETSAIGLQSIPEYNGHQIINKDVSHFVQGHMDYRYKMDRICQMIDF